MRAFLIAATAWTLLTFGFILLYPNDHQLLPCMGLVGRSAACEADQATINAAYQIYQTTPALVAIAAGYMGIALARIASLRRAARPSG